VQKERTATGPIIRRLVDIETVRGVCGFRRSMITADDTDVANVSHLVIDDSREHYHKQMTEFYYVLKGHGEMVLDGQATPVREGDLILIPPGVRHTSEGELEVLIVGVPSQETQDIYFDEA
jgi:mannose-6-phosphate isomerase-like protein (cupin superfamily)